MSFAVYLAVLATPFFVFRPRDPFQPEFVVNAYFVLFVALGPVALFFFDRALFDAGRYTDLTVLVGMCYLALNVGFAVARFRKTPSRPITGVIDWHARHQRPVTLIAWALAAVGILASALYFIRAGQVPLLAEEKELARVAALSIAGNGYLLYLMTLGMAAVALRATTYYCRLHLRPARRDFRGLLFVALTFATIMLLTGSRRYSFWILLYILVARHYLYRRIPYIVIAGFGIISFTLVNVFELYRNSGSDTAVDLLTAASYRLIIYGSNLEKIFSSFDEAGKLLYGSTFFMDVLTVLPGRQVDYQSWLKELLGLDFAGFGIPPTLVGDLFINFGWWGTLLGAGLFGFASRLMYAFSIVAKRWKGLAVFVYTLSLEIMLKILTSGFSAQLISIIWVAMLVTAIVLACELLSVGARQPIYSRQSAE